MKNIFENYETPHRIQPLNGDYINEYKILGALGEGTFGRVYKVKGPNGEILALKLIKLWEIAYEKERKSIVVRFVREYEISSTVRSEYLVKSYGFGKILGNPYILMEFCEPGALDNWVGRFAANPHYETISRHILKGLHTLHIAGYFHRDIKPANILLSAHNKGKIADFGIAGHKTSRLTVTNIFGKIDPLGTWAYLAPEQQNNRGGEVFRALDAVTDIFSFGVTMFELFTGELPFAPYAIVDQQGLLEYRENVKKGAFTNLYRKQHMIPAKWVPVIEGCLQPDFQKKRFKKINDIILQLGYDSVESPSISVDIDDLGLQITYGEELNKIFPLSRLLNDGKNTVLTLGRKDDTVINSIEIEEVSSTYISRRHATLEKWEHPKCWRIRDGQWSNDGWKASLNGLLVNSVQVSMGGTKIEVGDIITIGDTIIKVIAL